MYQYLVISFQKSAAVHLARHCPSTRTERIFMDWLWWILQGLPFTHLVSYCNLTVLIEIPVLSVQNFATQASKYRKLTHSKFQVLGAHGLCWFKTENTVEVFFPFYRMFSSLIRTLFTVLEG